MKPPVPLLVALLTLPLAAQDIRTDLVSYWPMDEVSPDGLTTPDRISGHDLLLTNMSAADFVPGQKGNCANLDGASQILTLDVEAVATPGLPLLSNASFTIAMWVKGIGSDQQDRRIISEASLLTNTPLFGLGTDSAAAPNGTGVLDIYVRNDANAAVINHQKTVARPLDDAWHHIAITDSAGVIRFYVDGVLDATSVTYTRGTLATDTLTIGGIRRSTGTGFYFRGQVDDVAVWKRALSGAEVAGLSTDGIGVDRPGPYLQGDRIQLAARAVLEGNPTFQWRRNGADLPGATGSTYLIPAIGSGSDGTYQVVINGTETSPPLDLTFTPDPAPSVPTNLVSWWPGESIDTAAIPATTPDPWGGHALVCEGMDETHLVAGKFGTAFSFDGVTQHAYRTSGFPIAGNPEYSISLWVKADGIFQNDFRFFAEGSGASNTPLLGLGTSTAGTDRMRMFLRSDGGTLLLNHESSAPVCDDQWHHVVLTDRNGVVRLYVDGLHDATQMNYNRTGQSLTLNQTSLGAIQRAAVSHWCVCQLDDVAVWNRALTWTEVQSLMTNGVPAPVAAVPPEVTIQPKSRTVYQGRAVTFSIQATGTAPLDFQWLKNNNPITNATSFEFTIASTVLADAGSYSCRVTNAAGNDTSDAAALAVLTIEGLGSGLLTCHPLDEGETETIDTISGQHLTLFNLDPFIAYEPGMIGNGLTFDGADDILVRSRTGTGDDVPLSTRDEFTVAFWVRGFGIGQTDRRVFSESSTSNNNPLFNIGTDNGGASESLDFFIRGDGGAVPVNHLKSIAPVFNGEWHHVIYTDYLGQGQLYVDGNPDLALGYTRPVSTFTDMSFGGIARATRSHWFAGTIDHFCTWKRALSPDEIALLYQMALGTAEDVLTVEDVEVIAGGRLQFTVRTQLGPGPYRVDTTTGLAAGSWVPAEGATIGPVTNGVFTVEVPMPAGAEVAFFRVASVW